MLRKLMLTSAVAGVLAVAAVPAQARPYFSVGIAVPPVVVAPGYPAYGYGYGYGYGPALVAAPGYYGGYWGGYYRGGYGYRGGYYGGYRGGYYHGGYGGYHGGYHR